MASRKQKPVLKPLVKQKNIDTKCNVNYRAHLIANISISSLFAIFFVVGAFIPTKFCLDNCSGTTISRVWRIIFVPTVLPVATIFWTTIRPFCVIDKIKYSKKKKKYLLALLIALFIINILPYLTALYFTPISHITMYNEFHCGIDAISACYI